MRIEFEQNFEDIADASWMAVAADVKEFNQYFRVAFQYTVVAGTAALAVLVFAGEPIKALVAFFAVFAMCAYFFRTTSRSQYAAYFRTVYGTRPMRVCVMPDDVGLNVETDAYKLLTYWHEVSRINDTGDAIYIQYYNRTALKIPLTAFTESADLGRFMAFTTARIGQQKREIDAHDS